MLSTTLSATISLLAMLSTSLSTPEGRHALIVLEELSVGMDCAQDRGASKIELLQSVQLNTVTFYLTAFKISRAGIIVTKHSLWVLYL